MTKRKICILALDGGGIRGILPGVILAHVEKRLQQLDGDHARIADYFDLIAGTSTGGILTCGYLVPNSDGRPQHRAEDVVRLYRERGDRIFRHSPAQILLRGLSDAKYRANGLEQELERFFGNAQLKDLLKPCLISSYEITRRRAVFFNKSDCSDPRKNFLVRDVARATSAAPTYFKAARIESFGETTAGERRLSLIDGGLVANNPGMCAYAEARSMDFSEELEDPDLPQGKPSARDMVLISIGTGKPKMKSYNFNDAKDWGTVKWIAPIIDIMMTANAETVDYQLRKMFATVKEQGGFYKRLEPELLEASAEMDDTSKKNLESLWQDGLAFITDHSAAIEAVIDKVRACGPAPPSAAPRESARSAPSGTPS